MIRRLAAAYFAGAVAALLSSVLLSVATRADLTLGVRLAPGLDWDWVSRQVLWGSIFAMGYPLLRLRLTPIRTGLLLSLLPSGLALLHQLPRADHGFLGLELSPYAPLVVVAANAVWGLLLPQVMRAMRGLGPVLT